MSRIKQVIVVRADLKMQRGKECAQSAHASMQVFINRKDIMGGTTRLAIPLWPQAVEWFAGNFAKICVRVDSQEELLSVYSQAQQAGIPSALIIDSGKTVFHGVETPTVVAIGPWDSEDIDKITGKLKLY